MKNMKVCIQVVTITLVSALAINVALAKKGGTNIYHYMVKTMLQANAVYDADAQGRLDVKIRQQGNADQTSLHLRLSNLDSNTTYTLLAQFVGESNATEVATFDTNAKGQADLDYASHGNSQGKSRGHGHSGSLPAELDPLLDIVSLSIDNASTQTVLTADLDNPDLVQYLVKHVLDNDDVESNAFGVVMIKANNQKQQFRLQASGLTGNTDYWLVINESDTVTSITTTDAGGKLQINSLPGGAPNVLDIRSVELQNTSSNSVLSATIP